MTIPLRKLLILFLAIAIGVGTFSMYAFDLTEYGATWDELIFHRNYGRYYTEFLKTGKLESLSADDNASWFPPVAVTVGNVFLESKFLSQFYSTNTDRFHLAAVLFGSITVATVFLIGYFLFQHVWFGLLASGLLLTYPQFVTQAHTNVRDAGLTMFYSVTMLLFVLSMKSRKFTLVLMFLAGFLAGITTDAKQNGAFLVLIGLMWFSINYKILGLKRLIFGSFFFILFFIAAFFMFWPYLWIDTVRHLQLAWHFLTTPSIIAGSTTFYDKVYTSMKNIPVFYPWAMLFLVTPIPMALLMTIGILVSMIRLIKRSPDGLLFLWIFIPLSRFFFPLSSSTFDQIRHFFEVVPSLPLFSTLTLFTLYRVVRKYTVFRWGVIGFGVLVLSYNGYISWKYQPYGTAYFNVFAGSPEYVNHAFDVEYWGNVYRKAVPYLNATYGPNVTYYSAGLGAHILVEEGLKGKLTDNAGDAFDYVIFMNKTTYLRGNDYVMWLLNTKEPIYTIEREGKVLFYEFLPSTEEYQKYQARRLGGH